MESVILNFLKNQRVSVLAVSLPEGMPHAASMHFAHREEPLSFYFSTDKKSRKCDALVNGLAEASLVVGMDESTMITFQMEGELREVEAWELAEIKNIYYGKFPHAKEFENHPDTLFLKFTPNWWRYTDYNTDPETILSS